jgi:hypothetical protein
MRPVALLSLPLLLAGSALAQTPGPRGPAGAETDIDVLVERLARVGRAFAPTFSPDGRYVALISDLGGVPQVWIVPAAGGWPRLVTAGDGCARISRVERFLLSEGPRLPPVRAALHHRELPAAGPAGPSGSDETGPARTEPGSGALTRLPPRIGVGQQDPHAPDAARSRMPSPEAMHAAEDSGLTPRGVAVRRPSSSPQPGGGAARGHTCSSRAQPRAPEESSIRR